MKRLALLAVPIALIFCLILVADDAFSRGGGGGRVAAVLEEVAATAEAEEAAYGGGGAAHRSPSMSSHRPRGLSIAVKTGAIEQGRLSPAASFDSQPGGISTARFFRPESFLRLPAQE